MSTNEITLFVMQGCQICPQMERLFEKMHQQGAIDSLQIIDLQQQPELAEQHNIRTVPHYLINGVAFNGLKTQQEVVQLLQQDEVGKWVELITEELTGGQLDSVEQEIKQQPAARDAMLQLLADPDTALVVRIGLSAIIESLVEGDLLHPYEKQFIALSAHEDERIAIDAMYYLSLLSTPDSMQALSNIAEHGSPAMRTQALEMLQESGQGQPLH